MGHYNTHRRVSGTVPWKSICRLPDLLLFYILILILEWCLTLSFLHNVIFGKGKHKTHLEIKDLISLMKKVIKHPHHPSVNVISPLISITGCAHLSQITASPLPGCGRQGWSATGGRQWAAGRGKWPACAACLATPGTGAHRTPPPRPLRHPLRCHRRRCCPRRCRPRRCRPTPRTPRPPRIPPAPPRPLPPGPEGSTREVKPHRGAGGRRQCF